MSSSTTTTTTTSKTNSPERKKREEVARLSKAPLFGKWQTIIKPSSSSSNDKEEPGFHGRNGEGLRASVNNFPYTPGVYEVRIIPPGGKPSDAEVVYFGKAGGDGTKSTLNQRMRQYMLDGSHKKELYDAITKAGFEIQVRAAPVGKETRGSTSDEKVKQVESDILERYDYALNKMENGKLRLDQIKFKVDGKMVSLKEIAEKHGYIPKNNKNDGRPLSASSPNNKSTTTRGGGGRGRGRGRGGSAKKPQNKSNVNNNSKSRLASSSSSKGKSGQKASQQRNGLRKDGKPDMRFTENKKAVAAALEQSMKLRKDGRPDMRFSQNKIQTAPTSSPKSSSSSSKKTVASGTTTAISDSRPNSRGAIVTKSDGTPDMRFTENKERFGSLNVSSSSSSSYSSPSYSSYSSYSSSSYSISDYGMSRMGDYGGYSVPLTNSGMPDMRYSVNKDLFG